MPRSSAADTARTARRILESARGRFGTEGYATASVDDIARDAGVTRGAVYHHFTDKRGLLRAVAAEGHARVAAHVVTVAETHTDFGDQLRAGCHAFLDAVTADETARIILVEAPAALGWDEWRRLDNAASVRELRDAVGELAPAGDVEALTRMLSGAMNDAALWLVERPDDDDARAAAHRALDRLVTAVIDDPAPR